MGIILFNLSNEHSISYQSMNSGIENDGEEGGGSES